MARYRSCRQPNESSRRKPRHAPRNAAGVFSFLAHEWHCTTQQSAAARHEPQAMFFHTALEAIRTAEFFALKSKRPYAAYTENAGFGGRASKTIQVAFRPDIAPLEPTPSLPFTHHCLEWMPCAFYEHQASLAPSAPPWLGCRSTPSLILPTQTQ